MPFMGRDWRSPGEAWVKTESLGWQRMKIIESQLYLTACHHDHPACSWPPRNQFGQHMANNCNKAQDTDCDEGMVGGMSNCRSARNLASSGEANSGDSSDSSRQSSASSSPTGSPEKNNPSRHIHPIAISSPYGSYSASCCAHHSSLVNQNNNNSTKNLQSGASGATNHSSITDPKYLTCANHMPRSLSRETIIESNQEVTSKHRSHRSLANNAGIQDYKNPTTNTRNAALDCTLETKTQSTHNEDKDEIVVIQSCAHGFNRPKRSVQPSAPILMRNGVQIDVGRDPVDLPGVNSLCEARSNLALDASYHDDRSASSSPSELAPQNQDNDPSCHLACGCCCCSGHLSSAISKEQQPKTAPHCRISVRTREVAMHNTISEAFYRLDFYNAIHDIRRFNYICKLLHLLITQNLTSLSGCATRVLFTMLEQVAYEVSSNKRDIHIIRNLLEELRLTIQKYYCWGRPIGSSLLWQQHFETIERIGQIVNGIELSPPKYDSSKASFSNLPVEMIREILLRLNDYRDLVNTAQASPVMRLMIDDQCIWQKLCRYHFTEQQIKLAFESNDLVRKHTLRGIKYARTVSADGRSSYRKPVTHKRSPASSSSSSSSSSRPTARQQLEETADRRTSGASCNSNGTKPATSHVTDAVEKFDRALRLIANSPGQSTSSGTARTRSSRDEKENQPRPSTLGSGHSNDDRPSIHNRQNPDIDWERVFHQLRKRFDLKEEYADCLLLCRHCRCLFWKSFGHPCIKGDDLRQDSVRHPLDETLSVKRDDRSENDHQRRVRDGSASSGGRPSVASLSRNFDRQVPNGGANGENIEQRAALNANQNLDIGSCADAHSRPLDNLSAQLRERNANRLQRQQNRHQNGGQDVELGASRRREELVPKHVTITPQAFLKFFSL